MWSSQILQLTFALWELAKHRDFQEKLRVEINETLAKVKARGDVDFTANDFESMPYLVAFTKVRRNHLLVSLIECEIHQVCVGIVENSSHRYRNDADAHRR